MAASAPAPSAREQEWRRAVVERFHRATNKDRCAVNASVTRTANISHIWGVRYQPNPRKTTVRIRAFLIRHGLAEPPPAMWDMMSAGMAQAQPQAGAVPWAFHELPSLVSAQDPETLIDQRRRRKTNHPTGGIAKRRRVVEPPGGMPPWGYCRVRVEERLTRDSQQHQPRSRPDLPAADSADEFRELGLGGGFPSWLTVEDKTSDV